MGAALRTGPSHRGSQFIATRWFPVRNPGRSIARSDVRPLLIVGSSRLTSCRPSVYSSILNRDKCNSMGASKWSQRGIEAAKRFRTQAEVDGASLGLSSAPGALQLLAVDEDATALLASAIAQHVQKGDIFCLYGELDDTSMVLDVTFIKPSKLGFFTTKGKPDMLCRFVGTGHIGAGKSTFSRALIRSIADDEELTVASPTFMLKLIYDGHDGTPVHHFDLYRLRGPEDFANLDLDDSFTNGEALTKTDAILTSVDASIPRDGTPITTSCFANRADASL
eukprot:2675661-Pyramimonas_sp.AAC.1